MDRISCGRLVVFWCWTETLLLMIFCQKRPTRRQQPVFQKVVTRSGREFLVKTYLEVTGGSQDTLAV